MIRAPKEAELKEGEVWRAKIPIYGFDDAPLFHYKNLDQTMTESGMTRHKLEPCLWCMHSDKGQLIGMLKAHVDDLEATGPKEFRRCG